MSQQNREHQGKHTKSLQASAQEEPAMMTVVRTAQEKCVNESDRAARTSAAQHGNALANEMLASAT